MPEATVTLAGDATSVPAARRFVVQTLEAWGYDTAAWAAAQIVSELAANCALHARTEYCVRLVQSEGGLRLEVQDQSPARVQLRRYSRESTTGRGLRLVETLADGWGVDIDGQGKTVWVSLRALAYDDTDGDSADQDLDVDGLLAAFDDDPDDRATASCSSAPPLRLAA